jgi:hypothetical protein
MMSPVKAINEKVRGRGTASTTAGGPVSESGCDGRSASTEPNEGVPLLHLRQLPPLVGVPEMRGYDRPMHALYRRVGGRRSSRGPGGPAVVGSPAALKRPSTLLHIYEYLNTFSYLYLYPMFDK